MNTQSRGRPPVLRKCAVCTKEKATKEFNYGRDYCRLCGPKPGRPVGSHRAHEPKICVWCKQPLPPNMFNPGKIACRVCGPMYAVHLMREAGAKHREARAEDRLKAEEARAAARERVRRAKLAEQVELLRIREQLRAERHQRKTADTEETRLRAKRDKELAKNPAMAAVWARHLEAQAQPEKPIEPVKSFTEVWEEDQRAIAAAKVASGSTNGTPKGPVCGCCRYEATGADDRGNWWCQLCGTSIVNFGRCYTCNGEKPIVYADLEKPLPVFENRDKQLEYLFGLAGIGYGA